MRPENNRTGVGIWQRRRAQRLALAKSQGQTTCAKCGRWLDFNTHGKPNSPEVNHDEPFAITGEIAPPLEKLSVWCRQCNASDGGKQGNARRGRGDGVKHSQVW